MKLSVIMSMYKEPLDYLEKSIESILNQTFRDFEFIITIDNPDNLETIRLLKSCADSDKRIRLVFNEKNIGLTKSLNKALTLCKGEYIARMDADDISHPARFEKQVNFLDKNQDILLCGSWARFIDTQDKVIGLLENPADPKKIKDSAIRFNPFIHPTLMFRKNTLILLGKYNEEYKYSQDYDFILRVLSRYKAANLPEYLLNYRQNPESITLSNLKKDELTALKIRLNALKHHNYPKWKIIYLIRPLLFYLFVPKSIKLKLIKKFRLKKDEK